MDSAPRNLFFYELCRLCLKNEGFCDVFETSDLLEDIFACTGVKVSSTDNLPRKICVKCSVVVESSKELRILASKNDAHLRILFGSFQNDDNSDDDMIKLSATPIPESPFKPDTTISRNGQNSSKQKISQLLEACEQDTQCTPVIKQTISLRKDLFPPSIQQSPTKKESQTKDSHHKLLKLKVEEENRCKKVKLDDSETREYVCTICSKSFDKHKKFYLHQRLHNKKIYCPLDACGKKFATKGDLQKHLRTHTGEKPYLCRNCPKGFSQRVSLRAHMTAVHADTKLKDEENET